MKVQDGYDGNLDEGGSGGSGEKWLDVEYISKVQQTGFVNRLDGGIGKERN